MPSSPDQQVADATGQNWVDQYAPQWARPYLRLARADRPIGTWLLLWPCLWSIGLASADQGLSGATLLLMLLFGIGSFVMRGAGCTYNDIVDHEFDAKVARTASRPIPSGAIRVTHAWVFLIVQCLVGLCVLLTLNSFAIILGASSLILIAIYPFMKRITYWPQAFLGLTFNWGALLGWAAVQGDLTWAPLILYAGGIAWTIGYDTIYAHQDKEDDALIGVKSTALRMGDETPAWLVIFYGVAWILFGVAGTLAGMNLLFHLGLLAAAAHLFWQIRSVNIDDPEKCLRLFKSNRDLGAILFFAILLGSL